MENSNLLNSKLKEEEEIEDQQQSFISQKLENLISLVGNQNRYQICFMLIFFMQFMVTVFLLVGQLYFVNEPTFYCPINDQTPQDRIIDYNNKQYYICEESKGGCQNGAILDPTQKDTMSIYFKIYCDDSQWRSYIQASSLFGSVFGNFIIAYLAESYGRKKLMVYSWGITTFGIIGITCSFDKIMLIIFNFIAGFGIVPCNSLNFIIINEQSGDSIRQKGTTILIMSWGIFQILLSLFAYLIDNWIYFYIFFLCIPCVLVFILNFYVVESPSYLMTKSPENLQKGLIQIAEKNRKKIEDLDFFQKEINEIVKQHEILKKSQKNYNYIDILRLPSLRLITIASGLSMFIMQFTYYGTQMALDNLGGSVYLNAVAVAFGELLGDILLIFIIEKIPRKKSVIIFMLITTCLCLSEFGFTNIDNTTIKIFQIIIAAFIRIFTALVQGIGAVFVEELYPTPTRSIGIGFQMGVGLIGSTLAPIIVDIFKQQGWSQLGCVGLIILPFNLANFLFKETKGQKLQNFVKEHQYEEIQNQEDQKNSRKSSIIKF